MQLNSFQGRKGLINLIHFTVANFYGLFFCIYFEIHVVHLTRLSKIGLMAINSTQCLNSDRQVWWQESYLVATDIGYHIIIIPSHRPLG